MSEFLFERNDEIWGISCFLPYNRKTINSEKIITLMQEYDLKNNLKIKEWGVL